VRISNRIYQDPTRISNVREYQPGDALNTIHWKATARTGTLHVKTFEPSAVQGGTLILDLHEDSYVPERREARVELAITTAASIAWLLQLSGEQVGLVTNARDAAEVARYALRRDARLSRGEMDAAVAEEEDTTRISPLSVPTARGPVQAQRIIENLARVLPGRGLDAEGMVRSEHGRLPRDAALLPVVPQVTESFALTLGAMKLQGFNVSVFLISHPAACEEAARLLAPHYIHVFHIQTARDLHEINPAAVGR